MTRARLYTDEQRKEKAREKVRRWRLANPEKVRAMARQWQRDNPEKMREKSRRDWSKKRKAKIAEVQAFYAKHPELNRRKEPR